nr:hypothetical protein [Candidatus Hydrogenedentota bacterium]
MGSKIRFYRLVIVVFCLSLFEGCPDKPNNDTNDGLRGAVAVISMPIEEKATAEDINIVVGADFAYYTFYDGCDDHVIPLDTCEIVQPVPPCTKDIWGLDAGEHASFEVAGQQMVLNSAIMPMGANNFINVYSANGQFMD